MKNEQEQKQLILGRITGDFDRTGRTVLYSFGSCCCSCCIMWIGGLIGTATAVGIARGKSRGPCYQRIMKTFWFTFCLAIIAPFFIALLYKDSISDFAAYLFGALVIFFPAVQALAGLAVALCVGYRKSADHTQRRSAINRCVIIFICSLLGWLGGFGVMLLLS